MKEAQDMALQYSFRLRPASLNSKSLKFYQNILKGVVNLYWKTQWLISRGDQYKKENNFISVLPEYLKRGCPLRWKAQWFIAAWYQRKKGNFFIFQVIVVLTECLVYLFRLEVDRECFTKKSRWSFGFCQNYLPPSPQFGQVVKLFHNAINVDLSDLQNDSLSKILLK